MKIKTDTPVETGQTFDLNNLPQIRTVEFEEIIYEKVIKLEEQVKSINEKLDKILGETDE